MHLHGGGIGQAPGVPAAPQPRHGRAGSGINMQQMLAAAGASVRSTKPAPPLAENLPCICWTAARIGIF